MIFLNYLLEVLHLTRDIYSAYENASDDLKRQYLGFFWDRFEVADGVILSAAPSPLFEQLLTAEQAFVNSTNSEKALDKAYLSDGILLKTKLHWVEDVRTFLSAAV